MPTYTTPRYINAAMDSLGTPVVVLDQQGIIFEANRAWKALIQGSEPLSAAFYIGHHYLEVCSQVFQSAEDDIIESLQRFLQSLFRGEQRQSSIEYSCQCPYPHTFLIKASTFEDNGTSALVLSHEGFSVSTCSRHSNKLKEAQEMLHDTQNTLRKVMDTLPIGVWITDAEGTIIYGNPAGQGIWAGARYVGPEQFGEYKAWWVDGGQPIQTDEWAVTRAIHNGEVSIDEEIEIQCFDGSRKIILNSATPLRDPMNHIIGSIVINQDISARKQTEEKLRQANLDIDFKNHELQRILSRERINARTDELTGLKNRRHFFELGGHALDIAQRYQTKFALLLFDIDNFKTINDSFGHHIGDDILKRLARCTRQHLREADILGRYGGEEFVVALPNTDASGALAVAEHLRKGVAKIRQHTDRGPIGITISIGLAEMRGKDDTLELLIQRADQALYEAKNGGRNRSAVYQHQLATME